MNKIFTFLLIAIITIQISSRRYHSSLKIDNDENKKDIKKWVDVMKQQETDKKYPIENEIKQDFSEQLKDNNKKLANKKLFKFVKHLYKSMKRHRLAKKLQRFHRKFNLESNLLGGLFGDELQQDQQTYHHKRNRMMMKPMLIGSMMMNPLNFGSIMMRFPKQNPQGKFYSSSSSFGETISNDGNGPKRVIIGNTLVNNNGKKSKKVYHKADDMNGHDLNLEDEQQQLNRHRRFFNSVNNNNFENGLFNKEMNSFGLTNFGRLSNKIDTIDNQNDFGFFNPGKIFKQFKNMKKDPNAKFYTYSKVLDSSISNDGKKTRRVTLGKEQTNNNGVKSKKIIHDADDLNGNKLSLEDEQEELSRNKRFFSNLHIDDDDDKDEKDLESVKNIDEKKVQNQEDSEPQDKDSKKEYPIMSPIVEKSQAKKMRLAKKYHKYY